MLGNCHLTSLNYPIQRKIIVVVGSCIPYLITIFWRNQIVEYIFSWSQQRYPHIDPLEHVVLPDMLFTFSSFVNSTQVNDTLPSSSVGRLYRTYFTFLVSMGLTPWLNSLSWSLRPLNVTAMHRTFNLWGSPPLNFAWMSIHPAIASNPHKKKIKYNQWETHSNISSNTSSANYTQTQKMITTT